MEIIWIEIKIFITCEIYPLGDRATRKTKLTILINNEAKTSFKL